MTRVYLPERITVVMWVDRNNLDMVAIQPENKAITTVIQQCVVNNKGPRLRYAVVGWEDLRKTLLEKEYVILYHNKALVRENFPITELLELYGHNACHIRATKE